MSSLPGRWSSFEVTGQAPPPCSCFTLTIAGEKRAALYGGVDGLSTFSHMFIAEIGRHSVVSVCVCVCVCVCVVHDMLCTCTSVSSPSLHVPPT